MAEFALARFEDPGLFDRFEAHRLDCPTCLQATSHRIACAQGMAIHEAMVQDAHGAIGLQPPWYQRIDLAELSSEPIFADFIEEAAEARAFAGATIEGCDTSVWQGAFPWTEAVQQGLGWGIAKSSEGDGFTDPRWGSSVAQLLAPGPLVGGSYHFARPDLNNSGPAEAAWYLSRHPAACFTASVPWIFALDAESAGGNASWCYAFLDTVSSRIGYSCWFYSYQSWIRGRSVQAFTRPLWIAWPNPSDPPAEGWPAITAWQYGTRGFSVGQVDANRFLGDAAALYKLAGVGPAAPVPVSPPPARGGSSSMTLAVAPRIDGSGVDVFRIPPDGSIWWQGNTPAWVLSGWGQLPALPAPAREVAAAWIDPDTLYVCVVTVDGVAYQNIIRPSNGWKAATWLVGTGTWLVPASLHDLTAGPPGAPGPQGPPGPSSTHHHTTGTAQPDV
jgi:GH25 family lysozyme M1 (1,4-beta-N-acetylmuramidase)